MADQNRNHPHRSRPPEGVNRTWKDPENLIEEGDRAARDRKPAAVAERAGRRERKKAATRQAIADAALRLFLERGFEAVSITDVAEAADVARTTVFAHFATKEALVFDREADQRARLVSAITDREPGVSIPRALRREFQRWYEEVRGQPGFESFLRLVESSPALVEYQARLWQGHELALADTIAAELDAGPEDHPVCRALARFMLDVISLAPRYPDQERAADQAFRLIEDGWTAVAADLSTAPAGAPPSA